MVKKYNINLTAYERNQLMNFVSKGKHSAREISRARILLLADEECTDQEIVEDVEVGIATVERIRKRYALGSLDLALNEQPRPGKQPLLDEEQELKLITLAHTAPPAGHKRWTIELLKERLIKDEVVSSIGQWAVWAALKKHRIDLRGEKGVVYREAERGVSPTHGGYFDGL